MDAGEEPSVRVLWAGADPGLADALLSSETPVALVCEPDLAQAAAVAKRESFDAVVVDATDAAAVTSVLTAAASNAEVGRRMAACRYTQVPELVRDVPRELVQRLLAKPLTAQQLHSAVVDIDPSESVIWRRALNDPADLGTSSVDKVLRSFVEDLVQLPAAVIRPLVQTDPVPRLQLVVPISDALWALRRNLPAVLGWPLKASGSGMGSSYRSHPIRRIVGNLSEAQEVYCLGRDNFAYVAFFPWHTDLKVTVVIGFERKGHGRVPALHAFAVSHAAEFPMPTPHRHSPEMFYDPDYDWVITKSYVGPDRRRRSTSFINRYTFRGRRKALMPNEFSHAGTFVDVAPGWVWGTAGIFATLFLIDTAMTAYYVGGGEVGELNPLMRWALSRSPVLFWVSKSALVLAATFIVMRWHLWKPGRFLFFTSIATYAALDVYWLFLFATRAMG